MRRIIYADLERSFEGVLVHIDASESIVITHDGRDAVRINPIRSDPQPRVRH